MIYLKTIINFQGVHRIKTKGHLFYSQFVNKKMPR